MTKQDADLVTGALRVIKDTPLNQVLEQIQALIEAVDSTVPKE